MDRSSKNRLNKRHLPLYSGDTLFDKIARAVCEAECLPRKELYEAWETARRIHRRIKGYKVIEIGCGHGLLAHIMLLMDRTIPRCIALDPELPPSRTKLADAFYKNWPELKNRITFIQTTLEEAELAGNELFVSVHGCGNLTDRIIDKAITLKNPVALLPCCHDLKNSDTGNLQGWIEPTLAVDITRIFKLRAAGYNVVTQIIPEDITPKNRLLIASPS